MPRSNLEAKRPAYVHVNTVQCTKKCWLNWDWAFDYKRDFVWQEWEHRTVLPSGLRHNASVYFDIKCANPTAECSSGSPANAHCFWLQSANQQWPRASEWCRFRQISSDKMKQNENKCSSEQQLGFSNGILKCRTIYNADHILTQWIMRTRMQGVTLASRAAMLQGHALGTPVTYGGVGPTSLALFSQIFRELKGTGNQFSTCFAVSSK